MQQSKATNKCGYVCVRERQESWMVDIGTGGVINPTLFNGENKRTDLWQIISRQSDYRFTLWCLFRSPFAERLKWNEAEDRYTQTLCKHQAPAATGQAQWDYTITRRTINVWTASCINSPRVRIQPPMYLVYKRVYVPPVHIYVYTICMWGEMKKRTALFTCSDFDLLLNC